MCLECVASLTTSRTNDDVCRSTNDGVEKVKRPTGQRKTIYSGNKSDLNSTSSSSTTGNKKRLANEATKTIHFKAQLNLGILVFNAQLTAHWINNFYFDKSYNAVNLPFSIRVGQNQIAADAER